MREVVLLLLGAVLGLLTGMVASWNERRSERLDEAKRQRAERFVEFGAASWDITVGIAQLARAEITEKDARLRDLEAKADRINTAEAAILLLDDAVVFDAARAVDRRQAALKVDAAGQVWKHDDWLTFHRRALTPVVNAHYEVAQRAMGQTNVKEEPFSSEAANEAAVFD